MIRSIRRNVRAVANKWKNTALPVGISFAESIHCRDRTCSSIDYSNEPWNRERTSSIAYPRGGIYVSVSKKRASTVLSHSYWSTLLVRAYKRVTSTFERFLLFTLTERSFSRRVRINLSKRWCRLHVPGYVSEVDDLIGVLCSSPWWKKNKVPYRHECL